jgi:hypothetical protein
VHVSQLPSSWQVWIPIALPLHGHERWRPTTPHESVNALPEQALSPLVRAASHSAADTARARRLGPKPHHILPLLNTFKA